MKPTGRRAWRQAGRKFRKAERKRGFSPSSSVGAFARRHWRAVDGNNGIVGKQFPPRVETKTFTSRSLVGMSQSSRKRRRWEWVQTAGQYDAPGAAKAIGAKLRIGERLRPCPGCCACWGHRISTAYGEYAECSGPQINGKRKSQIKAMRKWQESLSDDCDGSGVLPARKQ